MKVRKRFVFYLLLVFITYFTTEILAFTVYSISHNTLFSWERFQIKRLHVIFTPMFQAHLDNISVVLHPYLGYVSKPAPGTVSNYGFFGDDNAAPLSPPKTEDNVIIGIFGGSFAHELTLQSQNILIRQLRHIPQFQDKKVIIHPIALGGYKQPQQVFAFMYFLLLGGYFDMAINIDGFNEVALPPSTNLPKQVSPFFPINWFGKVSGMHDAKIAHLLREISRLQIRQQRWAEFFADTPLQYNIMSNLLWEFYHERLAHQVIEMERLFNEYEIKKEAHLSYLRTGPSFHYTDDSELYHRLARMWKNASLQMYGLCQTNHITYFHFLQPNQYVADSKNMTAEEMKIALRDDQPYRKGAEHGYPILIEEGKILRQQGVNYYDLTMVFKDTTIPVYRDDCCHLNQEGYDIVAKVIGAIIRRDLE